MKTQIKSIMIAMLLGSVAMGSLPSCKKEVRKPEIINNSDAVKVEKIKHFIAWAMASDINTVVYHEQSKLFSFPNGTFSRKEIEAIYNNSNEYKNFHEKQ